MADADWTTLGCAGDVSWSRLGPDGVTATVGTGGGLAYLRRPAGDSWRWQVLGLPPGTDNVADAVILPTDEGEPLTVAVVTGSVPGTDVRVWLHQPDTPGSWTALGGPTPVPGAPNHVQSGNLAVATVRRDAGLHHTFVVTSSSERLPWIRSGIDPDGTWFPLATDAARPFEAVAAATAVITPGGEPQAHFFAVIDNPPGVPGVTIRVAVRENAAWVWHEVAAAPTGDGSAAPLTAVTVRDDNGRFLAAVFRGLASSEALAHLYLGAGRTWQDINLGTLPGLRPFSSGVLAGRTPGQLTVLGRSRHDLWTRTPATEWTNLGTTPGDAAVVSPDSAVLAGGGLRATGVSWDFDLWTVQTGGAAAAWTNHGHPGGLATIIGAYPGPLPSDGPEPETITFAVDGDGLLWQAEVFGEPDDGLFGESSFWIHHGRPAETVAIRAAVGPFAVASIRPQPAWVFMIGSDGHLWSRESVAVEDWSWVDHGTPEGTTIASAVTPVSVDARPAVHALARDGHLWMRARLGGQWQWVDRGTPHGQLIFSVLGAANLPPNLDGFPVAAVATGTGQVWINQPDGAGFRWEPLDTPTADDRIVAGIGVTMVSASALDITAVDANGKVWNRRWSATNPGQWASLGSPAGAAITAAVGAIADPAGAARTMVAVVAGDQLWLTSTAGGGWTRFEAPEATVIGGRAVVVFRRRFAAVLVDGTRRARIVLT